MTELNDKWKKYYPDKEDGKQEQKNKEKENHRYHLQKVSNKGILAESVLIDNKPYFLVSEKNNRGEVSINIKESVSITNAQYRPPESVSYVNRPYSFDSEEEVNMYIERAKSETLDSLYGKVKKTWSKYIDADSFHISICAADTIFTYFQDKIGLTHYLFFVGNAGSGKSNNLTVFQYLGYRNMTSTDISHYNIYQFFGNMDEGVGTLCEDEADNIDEQTEKMKIYKNGYITGRPVLKTDTTYGRTQYKYNTFGFKACAAERLPDSLKAKGFNQRTIEIQCLPGYPQYDISEIINPGGEETFQELLNDLIDLRNLLLINRLYHFHDKIPDIKTNLKNREKQLFKPVLRIFQNTETLQELLPVISKYVSERRESNANTLHAFLYRFVKEMIRKNESLELPTSDIWESIKESLPGDHISNKPLSYESVEFGTISQKLIVETLIQVFGAKQSQNRRDGRKLIFNPEKLERLGKTYDLSIKVKVGTDDSVTDVTDVTDVGLDKLLKEDTLKQKTENSGNKLNLYNEKITLNPTLARASTHISQSQMSHPSQDYPPSCYYCTEYFEGIEKKEYENHVLKKHKNMPCYPGLADINKLSIVAKGMHWEI